MITELLIPLLSTALRFVGANARVDNLVGWVTWLISVPWTTGAFERLRAFKLAKSEMTSLVVKRININVNAKQIKKMAHDLPRINKLQDMIVILTRKFQKREMTYGSP